MCCPVVADLCLERPSSRNDARHGERRRGFQSPIEQVTCFLQVAGRATAKERVGIRRLRARQPVPRPMPLLHLDRVLEMEDGLVPQAERGGQDAEVVVCWAPRHGGYNEYISRLEGKEHVVDKGGARCVTEERTDFGQEGYGTKPADVLGQVGKTVSCKSFKLGPRLLQTALLGVDVRQRGSVPVGEQRIEAIKPDVVRLDLLEPTF